MNLETEFQAKIETPGLEEGDFSVLILGEAALTGPGKAILFRLQRGANWAGLLPGTPAGLGQHLGAFRRLLAGL